jgi:translocation and assembly module TamB
MNRNLLRVAKTLTYSLAALILLIVILLLLLRTDMVKRYLLDIGINKANSMLNGTLAVGDISGSLFGELELSDISLVREQDTLCQIGRVKLGYQLSPLWDGQILIDSVIIDSVALSLRQNPDSIWNIDGLLKADSSEVIDSSASDEPFGYTVLLSDFMLRNTGVSIAALDTALHLSFRDIILHFSGQYTDTLQQFSLAELQVELTEPPLRLERLSFDANRAFDVLTISNLLIETSRNQAGATANYVGADSVTASGTLTSKRFDFTEFASIIPEMKIAVLPEIALTSHLVKDSLYSGIKLSDGEEVIDLALAAYPISYLLSEETRDSIGYAVKGKIRNIDVARWLGDSTFAYQINGDVDVAGRGFLPESMVASIDADMSQCLVLGRKVESATANLDLEKGMVTGIAAVESDFGTVSLDRLLVDIFGAQTYEMDVSVERLNLSPLLNDDSLKSDLNLAITLAGQGFDTATATGSIQMAIGQCSMFDVAVDTGTLDLQLSPGLIAIDTISLVSDLATIAAGGQISKREEGSLQFSALIEDLSRFHAFAGTDSLGGRATVQGKISGKLDSLAISGTASAKSVAYETVTLDSLDCRYDMTMIDSVLGGEISLSARSINAGGFVIDSISAATTFPDGAIRSELTISAPDDLRLQGTVEMPRDTVPTFVLSKLTVGYLGQQWNSATDKAIIRLVGESYHLTNFALASQPALTGESQRLTADGSFSLNGPENLNLKIESIDLEPLANLMDLEYPIGGRLSATTELTGTASNPIMSGTLLLRNGVMQQFKFDSLSMQFGYAHDSLGWKGMLDPGLTGELVTEGFYPLHLSLTDSAAMVLPDSPMELKLTARQLPFAVVGGMTNDLQVTGGVIDANITAGGTWNHPDMAGSLTIQDAAFAMEEIGVEYDNLAMSLTFNDNSIHLDSLLVARGKGFMRATGQLEFENTLLSGTLHSTDFTLTADKLFLARHSNFEIQISGNTNLKGSTAEPRYSGEITIDRSKFYVPFLTEMATKSGGTLESPPMLLAATSRDTVRFDSSGQVIDTVEVSAVETLDYYRNLRGSLTLKIPRNTWLKSPEMNIEISGEIRMVKESPEDFELFGPITVVRGKYSMYGKEFVIREGTLTFTGGAEYNPDLNLVAYYTFRSPEREKHLLVATITGKAFTPQVAFTLDGAEIPERDALAYVVFGQSMDEVTAAGTGGGSGSGDLAKGVAANMLAGQLASTLGKNLGFDVVEIDASSSLAGATITLGKYLTTDLFMSYQRGIGNPSEDDVTPAIVTLEYELTRHMALQLLEGDPKASGFDFVFKFDW